MVSRKNIALAATFAVVAAVGLTWQGASQATSGAPRSTSATSGCTTHRNAPTLDGASPLAGKAHAQHAAMPTRIDFNFNGNRASEPIAPAWWRPATATADELAYYGIPARPAGAAEARAWADTWDSHFTGFVPVMLCEGPSNGIRYGSIAGGNWGGVVTHGTYHDYVEAFGNIIEPGTADPCPSGLAVYDSWVGLGGYGEGNLMQNGVNVGDPNAPSAAGPDAAFYELLNSSHQNPPMYIVAYSGGFIGPHQSVNMATWYQASLSKVTFAWHNLTNGRAVSVDVWSAAGSPVSAYYSGNSAEFINENVRGTYVRSFDDIPWGNLVVKRYGSGGLAPFSLPHTGLYADLYGYETIGLNPDRTLSTSSFNEHWFAC